jgi:hypothetical protein
MQKIKEIQMSDTTTNEAIRKPKPRRYRESALELAQGARLLYSRREAARQLSISIRSLDYLISGKAFQTRRLGKKVLIPHGELVRFASGNHYGSMSSDK